MSKTMRLSHSLTEPLRTPIRAYDVLLEEAKREYEAWLEASKTGWRRGRPRKKPAKPVKVKKGR